jgi:hypothetical protein
MRGSSQRFANWSSGSSGPDCLALERVKGGKRDDFNQRHGDCVQARVLLRSVQSIKEGLSTCRSAAHSIAR